VASNNNFLSNNLTITLKNTQEIISLKEEILLDRLTPMLEKTLSVMEAMLYQAY
jgi:hypothetical protein